MTVTVGAPRKARSRGHTIRGIQTPENKRSDPRRSEAVDQVGEDADGVILFVGRYRLEHLEGGQS